LKASAVGGETSPAKAAEELLPGLFVPGLPDD
jgi:hypothetical protein